MLMFIKKKYVVNGSESKILTDLFIIYNAKIN